MRQLIIVAVLIFSGASLFADELLIQDTKQGLGREAIRGNTVVVHYTGKLTNGKFLIPQWIVESLFLLF